jgi:hypothetical protein
VTEDEIRIRSLYLFFACSQTVDRCKQQLTRTFGDAPLSANLVIDKALTRELGMLFRYWITRQVWEQLEAREEDAKQLNLAVLRLFTNGFKLPKDGSGLRYAELSSAAEEVRELGHRITNALGMEHAPLLAELQGSILSWRQTVTQHTTEALKGPVDQLAASVKSWAGRDPGPAGRA